MMMTYNAMYLLKDGESEMIERVILPDCTLEHHVRRGIDLIDGKLTEINVTSPTGIVQIQDLTGINIAEKLWKKLLRKTG